MIGHAGMAFTQTGRFRALTLGAFAVVYILWGSTYLAIAVAVQSIPPFLLIGVRSLAAGAILLGFAEFRNPGMPPARAWASAAASGVLLFGGCHGTLAYAEKYVSSGLAAVMLGTVPFWIVLIKFVIPAEDRPKIMTLAALVPGLAGVALFMLPTGPQEAGPIAPGMVLILLGSAFLWALVRSFRNGRARLYRQQPRQGCSSFVEGQPSLSRVRSRANLRDFRPRKYRRSRGLVSAI